MLTPQDPAQPKKQALRIENELRNPYESKLPSIGDKIGPNRIEQLIGEGGMSNVYKVWNEGLEVTRAIKILKKANDKEARERFLTEAKILADIRHPNILEIYNIGYYESQYPFIETEFVDGLSVKKLIAQNSQIAMPAAVTIAYFVAQALQYAHVKNYTLYGNVYHGLIHRDIKPDNILISREGIVKLMDFGIARPSEVSLHTVGAKIMGTLVYLSPEQLSGTELDHRSDIFSLGCVLYEMVTGQRAFPQKTLSELVQFKTRGQFKPVTSYTVTVPPQLAQVIEKSMSLEKENRYASAAEFAHDLYAVLNQISDRSPLDIITRYMVDPTSVPIVKRTGAGHPLMAAVVTLASAVVALGGVVMYLLLR